MQSWCVYVQGLWVVDCPLPLCTERKPNYSACEYSLSRWVGKLTGTAAEPFLCSSLPFRLKYVCLATLSDETSLGVPEKKTHLNLGISPFA